MNQTNEQLADLEPKEVIRHILKKTYEHRDTMLKGLMKDLAPLVSAQEMGLEVLIPTIMGIFQGLDIAEAESLCFSKEHVQTMSSEILDLVQKSDPEKLGKLFGPGDKTAQPETSEYVIYAVRPLIDTWMDRALAQKPGTAAAVRECATELGLLLDKLEM